MTNLSVIRENIQSIRDENHDEDGTPNVFIHDAVSCIETCVDLIEQGIDPAIDYKFNPQIFTREDVKIAVENNIHADNIMRYIDVLLNSSKEYQRALELACTDYKGWHYATTMGCKSVDPDTYIQQARKGADDETRSD